MYTKDKTHRITLRLNDDQFAFLLGSAEALDVSPSEFLRMVVNSSMYASKQMTESKKLEEAVKEIAINAKEGLGRENDEANQHNIL